MASYSQRSFKEHLYLGFNHVYIIIFGILSRIIVIPSSSICLFYIAIRQQTPNVVKCAWVIYRRFWLTSQRKQDIVQGSQASPSLSAMTSGCRESDVHHSPSPPSKFELPDLPDKGSVADAAGFKGDSTPPSTTVPSSSREPTLETTRPVAPDQMLSGTEQDTHSTPCSILLYTCTPSSLSTDAQACGSPTSSPANRESESIIRACSTTCLSLYANSPEPTCSQLKPPQLRPSPPCLSLSSTIEIELQHGDPGFNRLSTSSYRAQSFSSPIISIGPTAASLPTHSVATGAGSPESMNPPVDDVGDCTRAMATPTSSPATPHGDTLDSVSISSGTNSDWATLSCSHRGPPPAQLPPPNLSPSNGHSSKAEPRPDKPSPDFIPKTALSKQSQHEWSSVAIAAEPRKHLDPDSAQLISVFISHTTQVPALDLPSSDSVVGADYLVCNSDSTGVLNLDSILYSGPEQHPYSITCLVESSISSHQLDTSISAHVQPHTSLSLVPANLTRYSGLPSSIFYRPDLETPSVIRTSNDPQFTIATITYHSYASIDTRCPALLSVCASYTLDAATSSRFGVHRRSLDFLGNNGRTQQGPQAQSIGDFSPVLQPHNALGHRQEQEGLFLAMNFGSLSASSATLELPSFLRFGFTIGAATFEPSFIAASAPARLPFLHSGDLAGFREPRTALLQQALTACLKHGIDLHLRSSSCAVQLTVRLLSMAIVSKLHSLNSQLAAEPIFTSTSNLIQETSAYSIADFQAISQLLNAVVGQYTFCSPCRDDDPRDDPRNSRFCYFISSSINSATHTWALTSLLSSPIIRAPNIVVMDVSVSYSEPRPKFANSICSQAWVEIQHSSDRSDTAVLFEAGFRGLDRPFANCLITINYSLGQQAGITRLVSLSRLSGSTSTSYQGSTNTKLDLTSRLYSTHHSVTGSMSELPYLDYPDSLSEPTAIIYETASDTSLIWHQSSDLLLKIAGEKRCPVPHFELHLCEISQLKQKNIPLLLHGFQDSYRFVLVNLLTTSTPKFLLSFYHPYLLPSSWIVMHVILAPSLIQALDPSESIIPQLEASLPKFAPSILIPGRHFLPLTVKSRSSSMVVKIQTFLSICAFGQFAGYSSSDLAALDSCLVSSLATIDDERQALIIGSSMISSAQLTPGSRQGVFFPLTFNAHPTCSSRTPTARPSVTYVLSYRTSAGIRADTTVSVFLTTRIFNCQHTTTIAYCAAQNGLSNTLSELLRSVLSFTAVHETGLYSSNAWASRSDAPFPPTAFATVLSLHGARLAFIASISIAAPNPTRSNTAQFTDQNGHEKYLSDFTPPEARDLLLAAGTKQQSCSIPLTIGYIEPSTRPFTSLELESPTLRLKPSSATEHRRPDSLSTTWNCKTTPTSCCIGFEFSGPYILESEHIIPRPFLPASDCSPSGHATGTPMLLHEVHVGDTTWVSISEAQLAPCTAQEYPSFSSSSSPPKRADSGISLTSIPPELYSSDVEVAASPPTSGSMTNSALIWKLPTHPSAEVEFQEPIPDATHSVSADQPSAQSKPRFHSTSRSTETSDSSDSTLQYSSIVKPSPSTYRAAASMHYIHPPHETESSLLIPEGPPNTVLPALYEAGVLGSCSSSSLITPEVTSESPARMGNSIVLPVKGQDQPFDTQSPCAQFHRYIVRSTQVNVCGEASDCQIPFPISSTSDDTITECFTTFPSVSLDNVNPSTYQPEREQPSSISSISNCHLPLPECIPLCSHPPPDTHHSPALLSNSSVQFAMATALHSEVYTLCLPETSSRTEPVPAHSTIPVGLGETLSGISLAKTLDPPIATTPLQHSISYPVASPQYQIAHIVDGPIDEDPNNLGSLVNFPTPIPSYSSEFTPSQHQALQPNSLPIRPRLDCRPSVPTPTLLPCPRAENSRSVTEDHCRKPSSAKSGELTTRPRIATEPIPLDHQAHIAQSSSPSRAQSTPWLSSHHESESSQIQMRFGFNNSNIRTGHGHIASFNRQFNVNAQNVLISQGTGIPTVLEKLLLAANAPYDCLPERIQCHNKTRVDFLEEITSWFNNSSSSVAWLTGMAGTGKTTIAFSFSERMRAAGLLSGTFFCTRKHEECIKIRNILPTIARALALADPSYANALYPILLNKDPDIALRPVARQIEDLFILPFSAILSSETPKVKAIVIDALDECEDQESMESLFDALARAEEAKLPLKFLLTSDPEPKVRRCFRRFRGQCDRFVLDEVPINAVSSDIRLYVRETLAYIAGGRSCIDSLSDWPPSEQVDIIVRRADRLFLYAVLVGRYVDKGQNIRKRLLDITSNDFEPLEEDVGPLDSLYRGILTRALSPCTMAECNSTNMILSALACLRDTISMAGLSRLCSNVDVRSSLTALHSVIMVPSNRNEPVSIFHPSFSNFLHSQSRSLEHYRNLKQSHLDMATLCLDCLSQNLRKNMCNLTSDTAPNVEIETKVVSEHIKDEVRYSCAHFPYHILSGLGEKEEDDSTATIYELLWSFLDAYTAQWVECLSFLGQVPLAYNFMEIIESRFKDPRRRNTLKGFRELLEKNMDALCPFPLSVYSIDDD